MIQGFATPEKPRRLSSIDIALAPAYSAPSRTAFMPSAATLVFHPLQMVLAAGGYDSSGNVRLFKAQPKRNRHHEDSVLVNGNGH